MQHGIRHRKQKCLGPECLLSPKRRSPTPGRLWVLCRPPCETDRSKVIHNLSTIPPRRLCITEIRFRGQIRGYHRLFPHLNPLLGKIAAPSRSCPKVIHRFIHSCAQLLTPQASAIRAQAGRNKSGAAYEFCTRAARPFADRNLPLRRPVQSTIPQCPSFVLREKGRCPRVPFTPFPLPWPTKVVPIPNRATLK